MQTNNPSTVITILMIILSLINPNECAWPKPKFSRIFSFCRKTETHPYAQTYGQQQRSREVELPPQPRPPTIRKCKCGKEALDQMRHLGQCLDLYVSKTHMAGGSQGMVYHAYTTVQDRCVALKVINYRTEPDMKAMAEQEFKGLCYMNEKGIKHVISLIADDQGPIYYDRKAEAMFILVMELGQTSLREYWDNYVQERHTDLEKIEEIKRLANQMLNAFIEIHSAGILHMDFKMQNVIMLPEPSPSGVSYLLMKLIDFASAEFTNRAGDTDAFIRPTFNMGSLGYVAPEQRLPQHYSGVISSKSDIFAFGCVLFEMLMGITPNHYFHEVQSKHAMLVKMQSFESDLRAAAATWDAQRRLLYEPLLHMAKACLDVEPVSRPRAYQLMAYFRGGCLLPVNMVYGGVAKSFSLSTSTNLPFCNLISESQFIQMAAPIRMGRSESMDRLPARHTAPARHSAIGQRSSLAPDMHHPPQRQQSLPPQYLNGGHRYQQPQPQQHHYQPQKHQYQPQMQNHYQPQQLQNHYQHPLPAYQPNNAEHHQQQRSIEPPVVQHPYTPVVQNPYTPVVQNPYSPVVQNHYPHNHPYGMNAHMNAQQPLGRHESFGRYGNDANQRQLVPPSQAVDEALRAQIAGYGKVEGYANVNRNVPHQQQRRRAPSEGVGDTAREIAKRW